MKKPLIHNLQFLVTALFLFGLGALLFYLGEKPIYPLGSSLLDLPSNISELLRLGRIKEDSLNPSFDAFVNGELRSYRYTEKGERLGEAILNALRGDYGQAEMEKVGVGTLVGPAALASYVGLFVCVAASIAGAVIPLWKKGRADLLYEALFTLMLLSFILFGILLPKIETTSICSLSASCYFFSRLCKAKYNASWRKTSYKSILFVAFAMLIWILLSAFRYSPDLGGLMFEAIRRGDSHTYAVACFFVLSLPLVPLWGRTLVRDAHNLRAHIRQARN